MFNLSVIFATARSTYLSTANFFVISYEQKQLQFVLVIKKTLQLLHRTTNSPSRHFTFNWLRSIAFCITNYKCVANYYDSTPWIYSASCHDWVDEMMVAGATFWFPKVEQFLYNTKYREGYSNCSIVHAT